MMLTLVNLNGTKVVINLGMVKSLYHNNPITPHKAFFSSEKY